MPVGSGILLGWIERGRNQPVVSSALADTKESKFSFKREWLAALDNFTVWQACLISQCNICLNVVQLVIWNRSLVLILSTKGEKDILFLDTYFLMHWVLSNVQDPCCSSFIHMQMLSYRNNKEKKWWRIAKFSTGLVGNLSCKIHVIRWFLIFMFEDSNKIHVVL